MVALRRSASGRHRLTSEDRIRSVAGRVRYHPLREYCDSERTTEKWNGDDKLIALGGAEKRAGNSSKGYRYQAYPVARLEIGSRFQGQA